MNKKFTQNNNIDSPLEKVNHTCSTEHAVGASKNFLLTSLQKITLASATVLIGVMGVQASSYAQQLLLEQKKVSFRKIFHEINKQTGYHYLWTAKNVRPETLTSAHYKNTPLEEVLEDMEKNNPISFEVNERVIRVKSRVALPINPTEKKVRIASARLQELVDQRSIYGRIVDENKKPLLGVSVIVHGKKTGVITDVNGEFVLEAVHENAILRISYVGYITQEVSVKADLSQLVLVPEDAVLPEAAVEINTGYQSISRERMTGSFSYVSGETLESKLATGLKNALEGQAAGVVIDKSGNIEIRGISTFNAQKTPLLVIDGYPVETSIDDVNPMNISSITVLKDGVAASIYGSRAANGVIIITTKMGLNGKPKINYSGFVNIIQKPDLRNLNRSSTSDYIDAEIDLFNLNPNGPSTTSIGNMSRVTYLLMQVREKKISEADAMDEINALRHVDGMKQIEDAFFRKEINHQHNLGIAGGSEEYNYNIAINYQKTKKNLLGNDNNRFIFDLKNEWRPFSFLTAGVSANFTMNNTDASTMTVETASGPNILGNNFSNLTAYRDNFLLRPYTNIWDENGNPAPVFGLSQYKINTYKNTPGMKNWDYIVQDEIANNRYQTKNFAARINGFLRANIVDGLTAEVGGNWERGNTLVQGIQTADAYAVRIGYNDGTSKKNNANHYFPDGSVINEYRNINQSWTLRSQLNYNKSFQNNRHRINALLGSEVRKLTFDNNQLATRLGYNQTAGSFVPINIKDHLAGVYNSDLLFTTGFAGITNGEFRYRDNRFVSWYANSSYEYDNRFILSGSLRLDLTNFFGTDKKYRYKPLWSLGGTYKLSNEKFWSSELINKLFVRGSYGINGNISLNNGPFLILSAGTFSQTTGGVSYGVASPPNNQLRWEKTNIANLGIDFSLLNNSINGSLDYYNKRSTDLLASDAVDPTLGYASLVKNVGEMSNNGLELSVNVRAVEEGQFSWIISPNIAFNHNKVNKYNVNRPYPGSFTSPQGILSEGHPAAAIWGYRFAGLNDKGESQVYNKDNEVVLIGNAAVEDVVYQGTFRPRWDLALTNRFKYGDWNLSFMMIAKFGHNYRKDAFSGSNIQNRHVGERWRKAGDEANTIYPVLQAWNMDLFSFPYTDVLLGNASYAKLRDVTLSYDLSKFSKALHIANAQIYFQGRNLFRITAKGVDIDPETAEVNMTNGTGASTEQGTTSLPLPREFFLGLRIGF